MSDLVRNPEDRFSHLVEEFSSSPDKGQESTTDTYINGPDKDDDVKS